MWSNQGGWQGQGWGRVVQIGGSTAYVTGNRTASITVTSSVSLFGGTGPLSNFVNGGFGLNNTDSQFFIDNGSAVGSFIKFDFGTGKIVDEAKWYQELTTSHGDWKWQGSNDDSAYTDIGVSFTLGGATTQTQTTLNGNSTSYRYYKLLGVSGLHNSSPWLQEIEFKQN